MILECKIINREEIIITRVICHYAEANNKSLHYYDETKEST